MCRHICIMINKNINIMKTNFIKALAIMALIVSCSEDDDVVINNDNVPGVEEPSTQIASVVLNEVEYLGNRVEIFNNGQVTVDLEGYFLCLGPGRYRPVRELEREGNLQLEAGEYLTLEYNMPNEEGGLGLYRNNAGFGNADNIVDFVQWGAAGSPRENVAVEAQLWTTGEFVEVMGNENNSIIFDGEGKGASNWSETTSVTLGEENQLTVPLANRRSVVFNEINYGSRDLVEIYNNGNVTIDLSSYWLCLGPGRYSQIGNIVPESGNMNLAAGEFLVLPFNMDDSEGLGLYSMQAFGDAEAMIDFVQWGTGGSPRENVAVAAGIWTAGDFIPTVTLDGNSIVYDGEGDASSDWTESVVSTLGFSNDSESNMTTFNVSITNVINYLDVHTFTNRTRISNGESVGRGPLNNADFQYQIRFKAVRGARFTPITMMGNSNDWFLAPEDSAGINLFANGNGAALNGVDIADQLVLFDLGTEADNMPQNFPPAGANVGPNDPNPLARVQNRQGRNGATYITAVVNYEPAADPTQGTGYFTLTIRPIANMLPNPNVAPSSQNGFVATPGIVVLHTQPDPVFTLGEADRGVGLEAIAEDGNPDELAAWFRETGSTGAPLRLASSLSTISPGLVYAFNSTSDPLVLQGQVNSSTNGLEQLAEDGNNQVAVAYLEQLGLPVAASQETTPVGPGESLNFTLEVPSGQDFKFGFSTMLVATNDWFISYNNAGFPLWDANNNPVSGVGASSKSYLYDLGTEEDQAVGFGNNQSLRQLGPNTGAIDGNNQIRRVGSIDDTQFGKGIIESSAGVVWLEAPRGGYNLIRVDISVQ